MQSCVRALAAASRALDLPVASPSLIHPSAPVWCSLPLLLAPTARFRSLPLLPASTPCLYSLPLLPASAPCFRCLPSTYCPPLLQITHLKPTPRFLCWLTIPCQTPRLSHVCQGLPNDVGFRIFSKHDKEGEGELPRDVLIASCQEAYEEKPKLNSIQ